MEGYSADDLTVLAIEHHSMSGHPIESEQEEASTRADEEEPVRVNPGEGLGDLDEALKSHDYPATTNELVEAYGDYELVTQGGKKSLEDVLSSTDDQIYDSAEDVRRRILGLIGR